MGFRNPLTALSELVADVIIGAVIKTAESGNRIELYQQPAAGPIPAAGRIDFYTDPETDAPAGITAGLDGGSQALDLFGPTVGANTAKAGLSADMTGSRILLEADTISLDGSTGTEFGNGLSIRSLDGGWVENAVCNASGQFSVDHLLGGVPVLVTTSRRSSSSNWEPVNIKASNTAGKLWFEARRASDNTLAPAGTSIDFGWLAIR